MTEAEEKTQSPCEHKSAVHSIFLPIDDGAIRGMGETFAIEKLFDALMIYTSSNLRL